MQLNLNRAAVAGLALLVLAAPAAAQQTAPTIRTGPAAGGAPAAGAPVIGGPAAAGAPVTPDFSKTHLAAALDVVIATQSGKTLDQFLPQIAQQVQARLIQIRPDLFKQIGDVVQASALSLAARRVDLDLSVARIWATNFTEEELKAIAVFYKSPAGQKLATKGPETLAQYPQAVQGWSAKVSDELMQAARDEMKKRGIDF
ncbi:MAG: DUF2059 domain-containing protein [Bauldia sp.]